MCLFLAVVLVFGCTVRTISVYDGYSSYYHHDYYRHDYPRDDWNYEKYSYRTSTAPYHHDYADNYDRYRNQKNYEKGENYYFYYKGKMAHMNTLSENGENYDIYEFDARGNSTYNSTHNSYYYLPVHAMSKYDSYYHYYYYRNLDSHRDNDRFYESTSSYETTSSSAYAYDPRNTFYRLYESTSSYETTPSSSYERAYAYDPRNHFYGRKPYRTTSYPRSVYRTFSQYHPYTTTAYDDGYDGAYAGYDAYPDTCAIVSMFEVPSIILLICLTIITSRLAWLLRLIENSQPEIPLMSPQKMVVMVQHVDRDMVVPTTVVADEDKEQTKTELGSEQNV